MRAVRALAVNGAVAVLATAITLLGAELGLRVLFPQDLGIWYSDPSGLMLHWPGRSTYLARFGQWAHVNAAGMRDREHPARKAPGVYRILLLGDSFMEALQVPFESSFPSRLERELSTVPGRRVEVVNASVSGWGTDAELKYLSRYGLALEPDLVLVAMTLHNDVSDNLREEFYRMRNGGLVERLEARPSLRQRAVLDAKAFLASRSHLYQLGLKYWRSDRVRTEAAALRGYVVELFRTPPGPAAVRGWALTQRLLDEVVRKSEGAGAGVAVFLIPLAVQLSDEAFDAFARAQGRDGLALDRPQAVMKAWGDREGRMVIDLLPAFREAAARHRTLYLERDGHWNEEGHRLAAVTVARELQRRGLLRPARRGASVLTRTGPAPAAVSGAVSRP